MGELFAYQYKNKRMKTNIKNLAIGAFISALAIMVTSCQKENMASKSDRYASIISVAADGSTDVIQNNLNLALVETLGLDSSDFQILRKAKDDEKLAQDVYLALNNVWSNQIFSNIARSESRHLSAVNILLAFYGSTDTIVTAQGDFENSDMKTLYNDLLSKGNSSMEEALKVGVLIEELDIRDLTLWASQTQNSNIAMVFENLLKGSRNHLRAFNRQLTHIGATYTPQYLDEATFQSIISSPFEHGKQYRMNKGKGNGNGSGSGKGKGGDGICNN
jgi:hypothetical protein